MYYNVCVIIILYWCTYTPVFWWQQFQVPKDYYQDEELAVFHNVVGMEACIHKCKKEKVNFIATCMFNSWCTLVRTCIIYMYMYMYIIHVYNILHMSIILCTCMYTCTGFHSGGEVGHLLPLDEELPPFFSSHHVIRLWLSITCIHNSTHGQEERLQSRQWLAALAISGSF